MYLKILESSRAYNFFVQFDDNKIDFREKSGIHHQIKAKEVD